MLLREDVAKKFYSGNLRIQTETKEEFDELIKDMNENVVISRNPFSCWDTYEEMTYVRVHVYGESRSFRYGNASDSDIAINGFVNIPMISYREAVSPCAVPSFDDLF